MPVYEAVSCHSIICFAVLTHYLCAAYLSCPAHIEIVAEEKNQEIAKEVDEVKKVTKKVAAQLRAKTVKSGGGVN